MSQIKHFHVLVICAMLILSLSELHSASALEAFQSMSAAEEVCGKMVSAVVDENIGLLDFMKSRSDRRWTQVPRKVLAFYYTWYGRPENHGNWVHWSDVKPDEHDIASSTHYPAKGAYDSHDPEIIDYHIQLAKDHGIDAFICTWWGQGRFDDVAFGKVLERAKEKDFQVTVYWETVPGTGDEKIANAVNDLVYVLERYGSHPAFLKVDGKPVIFVYGRVMGQIGLGEWPRIITMAQKRFGSDFLLIADGYHESYARLFDGIHTYNICGWVQGKQPDELRELSQKSFNSAVEMAKRRGRISCITIIPGYDDTKIRKPGINAERMDGGTYRVLWEQAIAADPDWVLITSWNEWHEGSEIEPSWEHSDKYIRITGEYTKRFKKTPYSSIAVPESPSRISPHKAQKLRESYKGKTIGILPEFQGEAAFWLAEVGVDLRELAWQDVLDRSLFSAKKFPVLVYAGGENYTQSLRQNEDIDIAILRYLSEGGLLVALPALPFPFFYNEKGKPVSSARKFGFPITGTGAEGWENPPSDVNLAFEIDNMRLRELPAYANFPESGDLRWRPSIRTYIPHRDVYLPLAKLKDSRGNSYGDGIVYIEHRVSEPRNGKNIYVWMRMTDILNADDVLYAIFQLAAEKMTAPR